MANKHHQPIAVDDFGNEVWLCRRCDKPVIIGNHSTVFYQCAHWNNVGGSLFRFQ